MDRDADILCFTQYLLLYLSLDPSLLTLSFASIHLHEPPSSELKHCPHQLHPSIINHPLSTQSETPGMCPPLISSRNPGFSNPLHELPASAKPLNLQAKTTETTASSRATSHDSYKLETARWGERGRKGSGWQKGSWA